MKNSTIKNIEDEIKNKTKLPKEFKNKIKKEVVTNITLGILFIIYIVLMILGSAGKVKDIRTLDLNIISFILLLTSVILFEIAYRKDSGKLATFGLEFLVISIFILCLPYILFEINNLNKNYYLAVIIFIASYYIIKSIYISIKIRNQYMNNISDIKEIVKNKKEN